MTQQITIEVDAEGNVQVGASGVKGGSCQALTRAIEKAIGTTTTDHKTQEFYQTAACAVPQPARAAQ